MIDLVRLGKAGLAWAQETVTRDHYLHAPVDSRCSVEGYGVLVHGAMLGCLLVGRPEATRVKGWYGTLDDLRNGRCEASYWSVLNLARVWLDPYVQPGGWAYDPAVLPGFVDRRGCWHSTLASTAIRLLIGRVGVEYLLARPPCFLDEPYEVRWLLSYCDTRRHKGTIYRAAGFTLYRTNARGIQTWRAPLPALTPAQHAAIWDVSHACPRSRRYRAARTVQQLTFGL